MSSYKVFPSTRNLFKSTVTIIVLQTILWILFINKTYAFKNITIINNNFRGTNLNVKTNAEKVDCTYNNNNPQCICPGSCMKHISNTSHCELNQCYKWDVNLKKCKESGTDHTTPLILNAIPFTSILGIGYGLIGRWDLFGMQLGILLGPCMLVCILFCIAFYKDREDNNSLELYTCINNCLGCMWSITLIVFYILSIIWVATPNAIVDGTGCPLSGFN